MILLTFTFIASTMGQLHPDELAPWTESMFANEAVNSVVLMFHVNWCGACKRTLPEFQKAAQDDWPTTRFASVDLTDHKAFGEAMGINAFPDLRIVTRLDQFVPIPYYSRDAADIGQFVRRVNAPDWIEAEFVEQPENGLSQIFFFINLNDEVVVNRWKTKVQFVRVQQHALLSSCSSVFGGVLVPSSDRLALASPVPMMCSNISELNEYIENSIYGGGVWKISTSQEFQEFNDQAQFKIIFLSNEKLRFCEYGRFAVIVDEDLANSISDEFPPVFVLPNEALSYSKFWPLDPSADICDQLADITNNKVSATYRGSVLGVAHLKYTEFLKLNFGIESEMGQILPIFLAFCLVFVLLMLCATRTPSVSMSEYVDTAEQVVASPVARRTEKKTQ